MMEMRFRDYTFIGAPVVVVPVASRVGVKDYLRANDRASASIYVGGDLVAYVDYSRRTDRMKWTKA